MCGVERHRVAFGVTARVCVHCAKDTAAAEREGWDQTVFHGETSHRTARVRNVRAQGADGTVDESKGEPPFARHKTGHGGAMKQECMMPGKGAALRRPNARTRPPGPCWTRISHFFLM